ncbi:menaquinone biosynthesis protein [Olivibacter sp. SDN3]|uniref:menaquinone biosynthetic enzyme MqnA/MqnD family protein n=1 Tax=Olivibacter sp. SDN3 TaxID=2764720 RepID=UPI001651828E|nr:menaquinone biosynthesis protein [Olivibacter sp. SDN3]QNL48592.1 menaquinone biosynthesis protein [Olivibacter sp. SDN3]
MDKIRVSAVSYTNTTPFIYGIKNTAIIDKIELSLDIPSTCAQKLIDNEVDIGLVPVAALLQIPGYEIISDYCIGANGPVNSVFIFSNKPVAAIETLRLDLQSRTSNNLARVLFKNYWKKNILLTNSDDADAFVQIGDRTFGKKDYYPYAYDMGEEWLNFTGLPFAFAAWATNKVLPTAFIEIFNQSMKFGLDNRDEVIRNLPKRADFDIAYYLNHSIDFILTDKKKKAIQLFHQYIKEL